MSVLGNDDGWTLEKYDAEKERDIRERVLVDWERQHAKVIKADYTSLPETEWSITFESLEPSAHRDRIMKWDPHKNNGAVLHGSVGTGKSTLCKALINRWTNPNYRALFISVGDAMDKLRNAMNSESTSVELELDRLRKPNLLILDDLGAEKTTEWTIDKIFLVFEARARQRLHTWFTTNLGHKEIEARYGSRIADRLVQYCSWIECIGTSYRRQQFRNEI